MIPKNVFVSFHVQVLVFYSSTMALFIFDGLLFSWKWQAFPEAFLGKTGRVSCCCLLFLRGDPEKSERKYEYSNISDKKYPSLSSLPLIPPFWKAMIYLPYFVFCSLRLLTSTMRVILISFQAPSKPKLEIRVSQNLVKLRLRTSSPSSPLVVLTVFAVGFWLLNFLQ